MPKGDLAGTTAFTYNAAGQISTLDDPFAASTTKSTYGYEASTGRLLTRADAQADLTWSRLYEGATGRLDTQTIKKTSNATTLASFDLAYDPAGNVTQKASTVFANPSNTTWSYDYDGASRMIQAARGERHGRCHHLRLRLRRRRQPHEGEDHHRLGRGGPVHHLQQPRVSLPRFHGHILAAR